MSSLPLEWALSFLQQLSPEVLSLILLFFSISVIFIFMRYFGVLGLIVYSTVAVISANIQALKATTFVFSQYPVALGTVVFSTVFLVSDILTEYYGKDIARKSVWISFSAMILVTIWMLLTISFPLPIEWDSTFKAAHHAMEVLFLPAPAIIIASLIAYLAGQMNDIWIFSLLSKVMQGKMLWLRTLSATLVGSFLDNIIFSVLAWVILSPNPLAWSTVFYVYILGTYWIRVMIALIGIPVVYAARYAIQKNTSFHGQV